MQTEGVYAAQPETARDEVIVSCRRLSVRRGQRIVVRYASLDIRSGETVSLIGPNGAGKTTLMLALLGVLPPADGGVQSGGRDLGSLPSRTRGKLASYVPQTLERIPEFSVYDVVATGRFPHVRPLSPLSSEDHAAIEAALEICGIHSLAHRPLNELSGGERQKTLIAAAIAQDARAMFLDEPSTALDPAYQIELVRMLRAWRSRGRAIVMVSHDLHLPATLGGRVIALRDGEVVADDAAERVLTPSRLEAIYGARFEIARTPDGEQFVVPVWWSR
ncbi:MAG: ABC transporter ATP-binding protein [Planctomycetota bacterium]|nr:MAG: ABC transporter ATP-binding protein [Planctomycetota bacterium]